ncbi:hypothetical protein J31TS4_26390 [Paenibacillus sp. J31TS4]|uniref:GNAT family N-acetyltransferase n=1 Tax=Paenibacillus sp. J31TS4 TaxID=2807195 RepID=UPI001B0829C9|nr:GNAT family N-acetyltransferase [Paenibacillus sp. J31TS4]GIP39359.1 hypothetical protein J31TS4_26390 [Paenibacillus sp. J31TS4]
MDYVHINHIDHPGFAQVHKLLETVFPPEEVLAYELWREPLEDPGIRVFAAMLDGEVVGVTEYRYYADFRVAMTDFTIIGREGLGVGRFLAEHRAADLKELAAQAGGEPLGMFAEIYDPYRVSDHSFGGIKPMDPFVRREVLSHLGYRRLDFPYVHPSWQNDGEAVSALDLCFLPFAREGDTLPAELVVRFLTRYYSVLPNKAGAWQDMIAGLEQRRELALLPF